MKVAICPHDSTKNRVHWLYFITYLSQRTGLELTMEQCFEFECYYRSFDRVDMTYSNPLDSLKIHVQRGFLPVAGNDNYDEVVIIAGRDAEPAVEAMAGSKVLGVEGQFATYLGRKILKDMGIEVELDFRNSWQSVISDVAKGVAPYGFIYRDFWNQLSELSKRGVKVVYESDRRLCSHLLMIAPELSKFKKVILTTLESMQEDGEGAKILKELRINRWYPVESLDSIAKIVQEV